MATGIETYRYGRLALAYFAAEQPCVAVGRGVYFPVSAMCETLGVNAENQRRWLQQDGRFRGALRTLPVPSVKGLRDTLCIRKQDVGAWLLHIEPIRCAIAQTRAELERFQRDLFDAADRFLFGDTSAMAYDPATKTAEPITGTLSAGHCPGCDMALRLAFGPEGAHLEPDEGA